MNFTEHTKIRKEKFGSVVFDTLTEHPSILDRIKTTGTNMPATISKVMLAGLFEVGVAFDRELLTRSTQEKYSPSTTIFLRAGLVR